MVLAVISLTVLTLFSRNSSQLVESIRKYFICEQGGQNLNNPCNRSDINRLSNPWVSTLSYITLSLFPVMNLLYTVNIQELKKLRQEFFTKN